MPRTTLLSLIGRNFFQLSWFRDMGPFQKLMLKKLPNSVSHSQFAENKGPFYVCNIKGFGQVIFEHVQVGNTEVRQIATPRQPTMVRTPSPTHMSLIVKHLHVSNCKKHTINFTHCLAHQTHPIIESAHLLLYILTTITYILVHIYSEKIELN